MGRCSGMGGKLGGAKGSGGGSCASAAQRALQAVSGERVGERTFEPSGSTFFRPEDHYPLDLFGNRISPTNGSKGRPRHIPTAATRETVKNMHQAGAKQPAIAKALGITVPTLILNYPVELESRSQAWRRRKEAK